MIEKETKRQEGERARSVRLTSDTDVEWENVIAATRGVAEIGKHVLSRQWMMRPPTPCTELCRQRPASRRLNRLSWQHINVVQLPQHHLVATL